MDDYTCTLNINDPEDLGNPTARLDWATTASFDTAIRNGMVVNVGDKVRLEPFTGRIAIPRPFLDLTGLTTTIGWSDTGGGEWFSVAETGETFNARYSYGETPIPATGPVYVDVKGTVSKGDKGHVRFQPKAPGRYTLVGGHFALDLIGGDFPPVTMDCDPIDSPVVIDTLTAVNATASSSTPVRPVVVQTDFAEDDAGMPPLLFVGALMTLIAGAVGLARTRVRVGSRRH